jgi:hypothetical protein
MTRREFVWTASAALFRPAPPARLVVPIHRVMDLHPQCSSDDLRRFWWSIWPEAVGAFGRGRIDLQTTDGPGEVRRTAGDKPIFLGLRRGVINLVLTGFIPMHWDRARALAGVTTIYDGYHVCVIALRFAHGNQVPFLSVNTCVHELLHALLQDVYLIRPSWYKDGQREIRTDAYATRLWLFHDGGAIQASGRTYLTRLRAEAAARSALSPNTFPRIDARN